MIGYPLPAGLFEKAGLLCGFLEDEAFGGKGERWRRVSRNGIE